MYSLKELSDAADALDTAALSVPATSKPEVVAKFKKVWPTAKMFLTNAQWITGPKGDKVIDDIIMSGEAISGNAQGEELKAEIKKIVMIWHIVRFPLHMLAQIVPFKVGKVVRTFITIVDELCDQYPEHMAESAAPDTNDAPAMN